MDKGLVPEYGTGPVQTLGSWYALLAGSAASFQGSVPPAAVKRSLPGAASPSHGHASTEERLPPRLCPGGVFFQLALHHQEKTEQAPRTSKASATRMGVKCSDLSSGRP